MYSRFVDYFLGMESSLGVFVESAETYSGYLQRLIQHLEEYLNVKAVWIKTG